MKYLCCPYGRLSVCCDDRKHCCKYGYICIPQGMCMFPPLLREPAAVLVNSTGKRCRDGTADMNLKAGKSIPTQQIETAMKRSGFIGTSGDVSSPDEKYKCPEGTSTCELSSGNDGCCPIQNAKWIKIKIMNTIPHPHSSEGMSSLTRDFVFSFLKIDSCIDAFITSICSLFVCYCLVVCVFFYLLAYSLMCFVKRL